MTQIPSLDQAVAIELATSDWRRYTIPASSVPVQLTQLEVDPGGGFTVVVRFPAGWERASRGRYAAAEEVFFLAGGFEMSDERYDAGDAAFYPAGYPRSATRSSGGALALAWFSGPQQWREEHEQPAAVTVDGPARRRWTEQPPGPTPIGVAGRRLPAGPRRACWIVEHLAEPILVPPTLAAVDVFDLAGHRYWHATSGQTIPVVPVGPVWMRTIDAYV